MLEETGLQVEDVQFLTAVENFFQAEGKHYVTLFMTCYVKEGSSTEAKVSLSSPRLWHEDGLRCRVLMQPGQNLEPEKCEGWEWWSVTELRERYERSPEQLFLPMRNLFEQRPEVAKELEMEGRPETRAGRFTGISPSLWHA